MLELLDNLTKIVGNHDMKFGVDFQRINTAELQPVYPTGAYNFNGEYTGIPGVANTGSGIADFLANEMFSANIGTYNTTNDHRWMRSARSRLMLPTTTIGLLMASNYGSAAPMEWRRAAQKLGGRT